MKVRIHKDMYVILTNVRTTGQFGEVFKALLHGQFNPIEVAIKTYKSIRNCTREASFMKEMARLSQLVHPNIVKMYGIVIEGLCSIMKQQSVYKNSICFAIEGHYPAMVLEFIPCSDLKTFLTVCLHTC